MVFSVPPRRMATLGQRRLAVDLEERGQRDVDGAVAAVDAEDVDARRP